MNKTNLFFKKKTLWANIISINLIDLYQSCFISVASALHLQTHALRKNQSLIESGLSYNMTLAMSQQMH